jgi:hypothetical protein
MMEQLTEEQEDAAALLATVRNLMTGTEIDICERIEAGTPCGEADATYDEDGELLNYTDGHNFAGYPTACEQPFFDSLKNQFYAKIANHKDGGGHP